MKRKVVFSAFKVLPFFLLVFLMLSSLLMSGCSPSDIIFGPSGSINVDTYPPGAEVFLNGSNTGKITPCTITNLMKGSYEVKVTFEDAIINVDAKTREEAIQKTIGLQKHKSIEIQIVSILPEIDTKYYCPKCGKQTVKDTVGGLFCIECETYFEITMEKE